MTKILPPPPRQVKTAVATSSERPRVKRNHHLQIARWLYSTWNNTLWCNNSMITPHSRHPPVDMSSPPSRWTACIVGTGEMTLFCLLLPLFTPRRWPRISPPRRQVKNNKNTPSRVTLGRGTPSSGWMLTAGSTSASWEACAQVHTNGLLSVLNRRPIIWGSVSFGWLCYEFGRDICMGYCADVMKRCCEQFRPKSLVRSPLHNNRFWGCIRANTKN